jgi:hypothetical protein
LQTIKPWAKGQGSLSKERGGGAALAWWGGGREGRSAERSHTDSLSSTSSLLHLRLLGGVKIRGCGGESKELQGWFLGISLHQLQKMGERTQLHHTQKSWVGFPRLPAISSEMMFGRSPYQSCGHARVGSYQDGSQRRDPEAATRMGRERLGRGAATPRLIPHPNRGPPNPPWCSSAFQRPGGH